MEIFLEPKNEEELEEIIRKNIGKASQIRKELETIEKIKNVNNNKQEEDLIFSVVEETEEELADEEYLYYYINLLDDLKKAKDHKEIIDAVVENLPTTENKQYLNIVNRIKLEFLKESYEIKKLLIEENDPDFIKEVELECNSIMEIIAIINELGNVKIEEKIEYDSKIENKIVFLETPNGSIYAENDLYSISTEYYERFLNMLLSIENGTFKNVKKFDNNNSILAGINEVKDFKTRITFDRIGKNTYIVLHAFIKKTDKDKSYLEALKTRVEYYKKHKPKILEKIKDEEYLESNRMIKVSLIKRLTEKNLVKSKKGE